jgi:hypothetical protein
MSDVTRILSAIEQGDTPHNRLAARSGFDLDHSESFKA